jgi:hypothetical protein
MAQEPKRSKYEDRQPPDGRMIFYIFTGFIFFIAAFTTRAKNPAAFETMIYIAIGFWVFSFIIWKGKHGGFGRFFKPRKDSLLSVLLRKVTGAAPQNPASKNKPKSVEGKEKKG